MLNLFLAAFRHALNAESPCGVLEFWDIISREQYMQQKENRGSRVNYEWTQK